MHSNKRKLNLLLFIAVCVFISVAATKPSHPTNVAKSSGNDTGIFKNLKVLPKNISKDSLDKIMDHFKAALGVRCNFCHVFNDGKPDFASDDKDEKNVARYMINMAAEINAKYFNMEKSTRPDTISVVKCVTCHHGSPHPDEAGMGTQEQENIPPGPPPPGPPSPHDSTMSAPPPNQ